MTIYSMTAFARQGAAFPWGSLVWEIRSVNHRYLEPNFRLPDAARALEMELRERLRGRLARGKVECSLRLAHTGGQCGELAIDQAQLDRLLAGVERVQGRLPQRGVLDPLALLSWPGVLVDTDTDDEAVNGAVLNQFDLALAQLTEHRGREGAALRQFIVAQLDAAAAIADQVRARLPELLAAQKQKLRDRLQEFAELNSDRIEQEMVILAQKSDVEEELDRLQTHIAEVRRNLQRGGPCGRRLDFLMQELNREANTLSSKSLASDTTQCAVELKVLIEQMREQIQNIE